MLTGANVRLEPLTLRVLDDYMSALTDPETQRLTGTHASFEPSAVEHWIATRHEIPDRADWAVVRNADGVFLGEAVINDLDVDNESANYRIWLAGPHVFGCGYGTEATRLVVDHALDSAGLHRLSLGVYEFNPRARRVYEKCGFREEGRLRQSLRWEGGWYDEVLMAVLQGEPRTDQVPGAPVAEATTPG
ncbi:MAG TPA: GNAT family protein [Jatrophihabitans sp.]